MNNVKIKTMINKPLANFILAIVFFVIALVILFSCRSNEASGRFVSTEKPVIVLDKVSFPGKIRIHFCFIVYLNQTINVEVDEKMFNKYNIGDTVKNVAVVIN